MRLQARWVVSALLVAGLGWGVQGMAMAKMVIFSAVSGKVLLNGAPVAGAVIEREYRWVWKDEIGTDKTVSSANGEFSLPIIERSSLLGSLLPHEPNIRQSLTIRHAGKDHEAWLYNKHSYTNNDELDGKPIKLICRLEAQPQRRGRIYGICEFE